MKSNTFGTYQNTHNRAFTPEIEEEGGKFGFLQISEENDGRGSVDCAAAGGNPYRRWQAENF